MSKSILKFSEAAVIALHSMIMLAQHKDRLLSLKEIANNLKVSPNHLSKVLQRLNKAGFIESTKGYSGGFRIIQDAKDTTFLEIYEIFDGKIEDCSCLMTNKTCNRECLLGGLLVSVNKEVKEKLSQVKLSDL